MNTYTENQIGPFIRNKKNAMRLIEWLMAGAPHVAFNIQYGVVSRTVQEAGLFEVAINHTITNELMEETQKNDCGTVVCIAGAACQMSLGDFGSERPASARLPWVDVQDEAFKFLGMDISELDSSAINSIWGLFNPDMWYDTPTGEMAARALVEYSQHGDYLLAIETACDYLLAIETAEGQ